MGSTTSKVNDEQTEFIKFTKLQEDIIKQNQILKEQTEDLIREQCSNFMHMEFGVSEISQIKTNKRKQRY